MTKVQHKLPNNSVLNPDIKKYDYIDCFEAVLKDPNNKFNAADIGKAVFSSGPKWIGTLFALRNRIVSLFGLKTGGTDEELRRQRDNFKLEKGESLGLFKVFEVTEEEVILGEDDKHLNFKVSIFVEQMEANPQHKKVSLSSVVEFNNWLGRLYFLIVKPFHKLIVPAMLNGAVKELENRKTYLL